MSPRCEWTITHKPLCSDSENWITHLSLSLNSNGSFVFVSCFRRLNINESKHFLAAIVSIAVINFYEINFIHILAFFSLAQFDENILLTGLSRSLYKLSIINTATIKITNSIGLCHLMPRNKYTKNRTIGKIYKLNYSKAETWFNCVNLWNILAVPVFFIINTNYYLFCDVCQKKYFFSYKIWYLSNWKSSCGTQKTHSLSFKHSLNSIYEFAAFDTITI